MKSMSLSIEFENLQTFVVTLAENVNPAWVMCMLHIAQPPTPPCISLFLDHRPTSSEYYGAGIHVDYDHPTDRYIITDIDPAGPSKTLLSRCWTHPEEWDSWKETESALE